jgi:hypothetical protein
MAAAVQEAIYLRALIKEFGYRPTDNQSFKDASQSSDAQAIEPYRHKATFHPRNS